MLFSNPPPLAAGVVLNLVLSAPRLLVLENFSTQTEASPNYATQHFVASLTAMELFWSISPMYKVGYALSFVLFLFSDSIPYG